MNASVIVQPAALVAGCTPNNPNADVLTISESYFHDFDANINQGIYLTTCSKPLVEVESTFACFVSKGLYSMEDEQSCHTHWQAHVVTQTFNSCEILHKVYDRGRYDLLRG